MNESQVVAALTALAQETRLRIIRFLVRQGPAGANAGAISAAVDVAPSRLSFHMAALEKGGLVSRKRKSRHVIYAAEFSTLAAVTSFLGEECCAGQAGDAWC